MNLTQLAAHISNIVPELVSDSPHNRELLLRNLLIQFADEQFYRNKNKITQASVKVMRSHDYCHFEVCLSSDTTSHTADVDALRKEAARLADKAVAQYKVAKLEMERRDFMEQKYLLDAAEGRPESERTPADKAVIKYHRDAAFRSRFDYDYQDDWQHPDED